MSRFLLIIIDDIIKNSTLIPVWKSRLNRHFFRDVKKAPPSFKLQIEDVIVEIEKAKSLKQISGLKKLKGFSTAYRIKINTYRLCFFYDGTTVNLARFLPRKDVYRFFP